MKFTSASPASGSLGKSTPAPLPGGNANTARLLAAGLGAARRVWPKSDGEPLP